MSRNRVSAIEKIIMEEKRREKGMERKKKRKIVRWLKNALLLIRRKKLSLG